MKTTPRTMLIALMATACHGGEPQTTEPVVGLPCQGCEIVFVDRPEQLDSRSRIAKASEGEPMLIEGRVLTRDGKPAAGVIVYAYHTDAQGVYPRPESAPASSRAHGTLRGWARTDADGRYAFDTIRPGSYPESSEPGHVHMHVIEPARCTYYLGDLMFAGDPRIDAKELQAARQARGGNGIVQATRRASGIWHATRDIVLGLNVPDYDRCAKAG